MITKKEIVHDLTHNEIKFRKFYTQKIVRLRLEE